MKKKYFSCFIVFILLLSQTSIIKAAGETEGLRNINFRFVKALNGYVDYPVQNSYHRFTGAPEGIATTTKTDFIMTLAKVHSDLTVTPIFTKFIRANDIGSDGRYSVDLRDIGVNDPGSLEEEYDQMYDDYDLIPEGRYYVYIDFPQQVAGEEDPSTQLLKYIMGKQSGDGSTNHKLRLIDLELDSNFNSKVANVSLLSFKQLGGPNNGRLMNIVTRTNSLGFRYTLDGQQHDFFQGINDKFAYLPQEYLDFLEHELLLGNVDDAKITSSLKFLHGNFQNKAGREKESRFAMLGLFDDGSTLNFITNTEDVVSYYNAQFPDAVVSATQANILSLLQDLYNEYTGNPNIDLELEYYQGTQFVISKDKITTAEIISLNEYSLISDNNINVNSKNHQVRFYDIDGNERLLDSVIIKGGDFNVLDDVVNHEDVLRLYQGEYHVGEKTASGAYVVDVKYNGVSVSNGVFNVESAAVPFDASSLDQANIEIIVADKLVRPVIDPINEGKIISGTGIVGEKIEVVIPDGSSYFVDVTPEGTWTLTLPKELLGGSLVKARHINLDYPALNSDYYETEVIGIPKQNPIKVDPVLDGDKVLSGTGNPGDTVTVILDDGTTLATIVDTDGKWKVNLDVSIKGGEKLTFYQTTPDGLKSDSVVVIVPVTALPPTGVNSMNTIYILIVLLGLGLIGLDKYRKFIIQRIS